MIPLPAVLLALVMAPAVSHATGADGRIKLKQWGLAYCIAEHVAGGKAHGGAAMGGYFQLGSHGSEDAYQAVRRFFDQWVIDNPAISKTPGTDLSLMSCINAYESPDYGRVLDEQDRFLPQ